MKSTDQFRVDMDLYSISSLFFSWHYWHFKCVLISHNTVGFLSWFSLNTVSSSNKYIQYVFEIQNTDTFDNRHYLWQVLNVLSGTSSFDFSIVITCQEGMKAIEFIMSYNFRFQVFWKSWQTTCYKNTGMNDKWHRFSVYSNIPEHSESFITWIVWSLSDDLGFSNRVTLGCHVCLCNSRNTWWLIMLLYSALREPCHLHSDFRYLSYEKRQNNGIASHITAIHVLGLMSFLKQLICVVWFSKLIE